MWSVDIVPQRSEIVFKPSTVNYCPYITTSAKPKQTYSLSTRLSLVWRHKHFHRSLSHSPSTSLGPCFLFVRSYELSYEVSCV